MSIFSLLIIIIFFFFNINFRKELEKFSHFRVSRGARSATASERVKSLAFPKIRYAYLIELLIIIKKIRFY